MSKIEDTINAIPENVKNTPGLGKSMAKWAAIGAVVAIPLPFTMPLGAVVGATYAYWKGKKNA